MNNKSVVIAALFNPRRGRIQYAMSARNQADLDTMTSDLVQVVRAAMHPEQIGLWLKDSS